MTGFKNFILRGNLVEIAVAFIVAGSFAVVITRFTEWLTSLLPSSADKVFASLARHPYVAGEFVWSGFDYLGEPTPYYTSRSSYSGIVDLAGFKKDRFYLYQAHWRRGFPMAHILPHWTWPERVGQITPVHIFTSGDEAELFVAHRAGEVIPPPTGDLWDGGHQRRLAIASELDEP